VGNDGLGQRFKHTIGLDHLVDDDRYATSPDRVRNRQELLPLMSRHGRARSAEEWTDLHTEAGVPVGPLLTVPETVMHLQILARDMVVDLPQSTGGRAHPQIPAQAVGHTTKILADPGISPDDITRLTAEGSIVGWRLASHR
jgi:crotonobetainyl-CoA:carnitine CoA-transferase CaiB-like acyl-CoA transferase